MAVSLRRPRRNRRGRRIIFEPIEHVALAKRTHAPSGRFGACGRWFDSVEVVELDQPSEAGLILPATSAGASADATI